MTSKAFDNATDANRQQGGRRNLIINGDYKINQRGNATGVTGAVYRGPDRTLIVESSDGSLDVAQNTSGVLADTGHGQSLKIDVNTADASLASNQYFFLWYLIEGQDCQQLQYGTANAKPVTLSFWIKSNKTGTYNLNLRSYDPNRMLGGSYTIDSADTWEYKTITYIGDTNTALPNDNGAGLLLDWVFAVGTDFTSGTSPTAWEARTNADRGADTTVNLLDNTANYVEITGVQLEVGTVATPFEHRSYGEELALCQRYYEIIGLAGSGDIVIGGYANNTTHYVTFQFKTEKRASPTVTKNGTWSTGGTGASQPGVFTVSKILFRGGMSNATGPGNVYAQNDNTGCNFTADAEL